MLKGYQLNLLNMDDFYSTASNHDISIISVDGQACMEFIINFMNECSESFLIIITNSIKISQDPLIQELDNICVIHKSKVEDNLSRVVININEKLKISKSYYKLLFDLLNIQDLNKKQKRKLFDICEQFKKVITLHPGTRHD